MEIEIEANARIVALAVLAALLLFGLMGRAVTPAAHGEAQLLTPARWRAGKLERRAKAEVRRLRRDVDDIRSIMERGRPSPVDAMLLAQRVYARERRGTSATAPAMQAVIDAAQAAAEYASGSVERDEAVAAVNRAMDAVDALTPKPVRKDGKVFFPVIGG